MTTSQQKKKLELEYFQIPIDCYQHHGSSEAYLHTHSHYELYLFLKGNIRFFINGTQHQLKPGSLLFLRNNVIHGPVPDGNRPYSRLILHFAEDTIEKFPSTEQNLFEPFLSDQHHFPCIELTQRQIETIVPIYNRIYDIQHETPQFAHQLLLNALMIEIMITANRFHKHYLSLPVSTDNQLPQLIQQVLAYIEENVTNPDLTLKSLGEQFSLNHDYLNLQFKAQLGSSIYQYILLCRIAISKRLLMQGENVTDTCATAGFNDYSNFIRTFKKMVGVSPKQYAKGER